LNAGCCANANCGNKAAMAAKQAKYNCCFIM
jgi:hypothetical protein